MDKRIKVSQAQRERLAFLELRAFFTGELRRADIETRFGIRPAAASRDLGLYQDLAPSNLEYDRTNRCYQPTREFAPAFEFNIDRVLTWLSRGFGDGLDLGLKPATPFEGPSQLIKPDLRVLSSITRSLWKRGAAWINYHSLSSGAKRREIVPVALADNGLRWHVRAYDRDRRRFGGFALTRIFKIQEIDGPVDEYKLLGADEQWTRIVDMELVPHPGVAQRKAIEADYGMQDSVLRIKSRAASAGYVLRRWSVDTSPDHRLDPSTYHLWLRNTPHSLWGGKCGHRAWSNQLRGVGKPGWRITFKGKTT